MLNATESQNRAWQAFLAASKKKKGPLYTRYVNRNLAIPFTFVFWKLGLTPNVVSVISTVLTHSAMALLLFLDISILVSVAAYLLLMIGYVTDSCDGQLARVSGRSSKAGEWLDHSLDMIKSLTLNLTLGIVAIRLALTHDIPLWMPFVGMFFNLLSQPAHFYVINFKVMLLGKDTAGHESGVSTRQRLVSALASLSDFGLFILLVLLLPKPHWFIPIYMVYGIFYFLMFAAHFAQTWRTAPRH